MSFIANKPAQQHNKQPVQQQSGNTGELKTLNIKGKEYVEVNTRIKYFREHFPGFALTSEIIKMDAESCLFKCEIKDESGVVKATGHAYEEKASSYINKTSHIENCETSSWGRALGNFGIGIDTSVASADELVIALSGQAAKIKSA